MLRQFLLFSLLLTTLASVPVTGHAGTPGCVPPPPGLVGWWPGDGNANDLAGNNDLSPFGSPTFSAGLVGQAFSFDGVDDFFRGSAVALPSNWGVDAWIFWMGRTGAPGKYSHFILRNGPLTLGGFDIMVLERQGTISVNFRPGTPPGTFVVTNVAPPVNVWSHVALTVEDGWLRVYLNARLRWVQFVGFYPLPKPQGDLTISHGANNGAGLTFNGFIDEVDLFNEALSAEAVEAIYAAGTSGKCKPPPPEDSIQAILDVILANEDLGGNVVESLASKLDNTLISLDKSNDSAAANMLQAFINEIEALMRSGRMDQSEGDVLIEVAQGVINQLI